MLKLLKSLAVRFKEPSSWAGLGSIAALVGLNIDPGLAQQIALIGASLAGIAAILIPE